MREANMQGTLHDSECETSNPAPDKLLSIKQNYHGQ